MTLLARVLMVGILSFQALALANESEKSWVNTVLAENKYIQRVYFTSGRTMIATVWMSNSTLQFMEITRDDKVTAILPLTSEFASTQIGDVLAATRSHVMKAEHLRPRTLPAGNLTDGALTASISSGVGMAIVPLAVVIDLLTVVPQFGYWGGKNTRFYIDNKVLQGKIQQAKTAYLELEASQYAQVKWALGQALPKAQK